LGAKPAAHSFDQPLDGIVTEQFLLRFERPVRAA